METSDVNEIIYILMVYTGIGHETEEMLPKKIWS